MSSDDSVEDPFSSFQSTDTHTKQPNSSRVVRQKTGSLFSSICIRKTTKKLNRHTSWAPKIPRKACRSSVPHHELPALLQQQIAQQRQTPIEKKTYSKQRLYDKNNVNQCANNTSKRLKRIHKKPSFTHSSSSSSSKRSSVYISSSSSSSSVATSSKMPKKFYVDSSGYSIKKKTSCAHIGSTVTLLNDPRQREKELREKHLMKAKCFAVSSHVFGDVSKIKRIDEKQPCNNRGRNTQLKAKPGSSVNNPIDISDESDDNNMNLSPIKANELWSKLESSTGGVKLFALNVWVGNLDCIHHRPSFIVFGTSRIETRLAPYTRIVFPLNGQSFIKSIFFRLNGDTPFVSLCVERKTQKMLPYRYSNYQHKSGPLWISFGCSRRLSSSIKNAFMKTINKYQALYQIEIQHMSKSAAHDCLFNLLPTRKVTPLLSRRLTRNCQNLRKAESAKELLSYPIGHTKHRISVTIGDLECLEEREMLNDSIIDFYFRWLQEEKCQNRDDVFFFSSFFFKRYVSANYEHQSVARWTSGQKIFQKSFWFIPINEAFHWTLAVVCHPGIADGDINKTSFPCILYFDSLGGNGHRAFAVLLRYMKSSWNEIRRSDECSLLPKSNSSIQFDFDRISLLCPNVPQQSNAHDCGIFLLHFAELFLVERFDISNINKPNWFDKHDIKRKRLNIRSLLADLCEDDANRQQYICHDDNDDDDDDDEDNDDDDGDEDIDDDDDDDEGRSIKKEDRTRRDAREECDSFVHHALSEAREGIEVLSPSHHDKAIHCMMSQKTSTDICTHTAVNELILDRVNKQDDDDGDDDAKDNDDEDDDDAKDNDDDGDDDAKDDDDEDDDAVAENDDDYDASHTQYFRSNFHHDSIASKPCDTMINDIRLNANHETSNDNDYKNNQCHSLSSHQVAASSNGACLTVSSSMTSEASTHHADSHTRTQSAPSDSTDTTHLLIDLT